ncbi:MAG: LysR family transcriptional regulator [Candidatus Sulfotelmatobacter sp.]
MRLDLELRHLYSVVVLAEMHFTRASHRLRIAQPSLSKQLQQIERSHGVRLFARDKGRIVESLRMQVALSSTKRGSPFSTLNVLLISLAPIVGPTTRL